MDVARSAPQVAHYHADVIYLLPLLGIKKGASALWYYELSLHPLGSRPTFFIPRWITHPCILHQACATRGASCWRSRGKRLIDSTCVKCNSSHPAAAAAMDRKSSQSEWTTNCACRVLVTSPLWCMVGKPYRSQVNLSGSFYRLIKHIMH